MENEQDLRAKLERSKRNTFRLSNIGLAVFHGIVLIGAIIAASQNQNSYIFGVKTFNTISASVLPQDEFYQTFANLSSIQAINNTFAAAPYYNTISAIGDKMQNFKKDGFCYTRPETQEVGWSSSQSYYRAVDNHRLDKVSKWWILIFIIAVTVFAHAMRALLNGRVYAMIINNLPRWDRWVEYSISSPLMIILIAYTTGTIESGTLLALAASQAVLVIVGLAIELSFWQAGIENDRVRVHPVAQDEESYDTKPYDYPTTEGQMQGVQNMQPQKMTIRTPFEKSSRNYSYRQLAIVKPIREENNLSPLAPFQLRMYGIIFLIVTWVVFILQWAVIFWNLNDLLSIFRCMNDKDFSRRTSIPIMVAIFEFLCFLSFGVVATVGSFAGDYRKNGKAMAYAYDLLSFFSKSILAILLIFEATSFKVRG